MQYSSLSKQELENAYKWLNGSKKGLTSFYKLLRVNSRSIKRIKVFSEETIIDVFNNKFPHLKITCSNQLVKYALKWEEYDYPNNKLIS